MESRKKTTKNVRKPKKATSKIRSLIIMAIIIIVGYYLFSGIIQLIKNPANSVAVKEGTVTKEENAVGYIIREETVVKGENYKNGMEQIADEEQKVSKGASIFRYYSDGEENIKTRISELNKEIQEIMNNNSNDLFSSDTKLLDAKILSELKKVNQLNSIQNIQESKRTLDGYIVKKASIAGELSPAGSHLRELIEERKNLEKELNSGSEYVTAPKSGILSYRIDGYEATLTTNDFSKYNKDFLSKLELKTGQIISTNNEQGKIVNNFVYYIACTSNTEEARNAEIGDKLKITLPSSKVVNAEIAYIINEEDDEVTLIIKLTEGIEEYLPYRKVSVDIIWWDAKGYKVPNSAIITENGLNYVIRTRSGYLTKILVKVVNQADNYSIVANYSSSELAELKLKSKVTASLLLYDEIILKPTESQINSTE